MPEGVATQKRNERKREMFLAFFRTVHTVPKTSVNCNDTEHVLHYLDRKYAKTLSDSGSLSNRRGRDRYRDTVFK